MPDTNAGKPAATTDTPATPTEGTSTPPAVAPGTEGKAPENKASEGDGLSQESAAYFKSQNLDAESLGIDINDSKVVDAFIAGHKVIRNQNNPANTKSTTATPESLTGKTEAPAQPTTTEPTQSTTTTPTAPAPQETTVKPAFTQMDIINMKSYLENTHKDVAPEKLGTQEFYEGMKAYGFNPVDPSNGSLNVTAISKYAEIVAKDAKIAKLEEDIKAKPTSTIPDPDSKVIPIDESAQRVETMTEQAAANIVIASQQAQRAGKPIHPQYEQAVEFMKTAATRK